MLFSIRIKVSDFLLPLVPVRASYLQSWYERGHLDVEEAAHEVEGPGLPSQLRLLQVRVDRVSDVLHKTTIQIIYTVVNYWYSVLGKEYTAEHQIVWINSHRLK